MLQENPKDNVDREQTSGIYKLSFGECERGFIGQRFKEHFNVASHINHTGYRI